MYLSINSNSKSQFEVDLEFIHFREKCTMKRPHLEGWTVCGILKNRFILEINTQCSAQKRGGGRFAAFLKNRFIIQLMILNVMKTVQQIVHQVSKNIILKKENWLILKMETESVKVASEWFSK